MSSKDDHHGPDDVAIKKLGAADPKTVTEEQWKQVLPPMTYAVTREADTERAFTGAYDKFFEKGKYLCVCCGADLFISDAKYNSGCGWPAFTESVGKDKNIVRILDQSIPGRDRVEVRCKQCNAHLGHVFDDGPQDKTGERYCINSVAVAFDKE